MNSPVNDLGIRKLKDQFSESTRTVRRNLLIAASIGYVLSTHALKLTDVFGIDLKDSTSATIAVGAISLVAAYELLSFVIYATIDHMAWWLNARAVVHSTQSDRFKEIAEHTRRSMDQLGYIRGKMTGDEDSVVNAIKSQSGVIDRICIEAEQAITDYKNDIDQLRSVAQAHDFTQLFRIYVVDWGIPLALGLACVFRNWYSMGDFLCAALR